MSDDILPLPPSGTPSSSLTCHFCIVGCGYRAYKWPVHQDAGRAPQDNALGLDFRHQAPPNALALTSTMHNIVRDNSGQPYHLLVVPDQECVVNKGLSSTRGGHLAQLFYNGEGPSAQRLLHPRLFSGSNWSDVPWSSAVGLYAAVTQRLLDKFGPDSLFFNCFDHGGAGGGFEDTWATGKFMFSALGTKMVRIHNRPAYNSECHGSRDMGISELNNSYEDAQLADVLWSIGNNPYETQSNYFLNHWLPNLQGQTLNKKRQWFPNRTASPAKIIFVDPRRTPSIAVAEQAAGKNNVLHLDIEPGTDIALFNGLFTYVVDQGWHDDAFIRAHTQDFEKARSANRLSLEETSRITGVTIEKLKLAAAWSYQPNNGRRPRTLHAYEKGVIWGNDNYHIQVAMVDLVLATRNVGRRGTGVVRMGGHQEGYARPPYPGPRPAPFIDRELMDGEGKMLTVWACNAFQTTCNAENYRELIIRRANIVRQAMAEVKGSETETLADAIFKAVSKKNCLFISTMDLYATQFALAGHLMFPAAQPGERNLTSMNGERRLRLTEKFIDPPGSAKPDCLIAADLANALKTRYQQANNPTMAKRFAGFDWQNEEDAFNDGFRQPQGIDSQGGATGHLVTYERLKRLGNNGVQLPVQKLDGDTLVGTEMLYGDGVFDTDNGKARFMPSPWKGLLPAVAKQQKKYPFWINNGRTNAIWQSAYHDRYIEFRRQRFPMAFIEMNPDDATALNVVSGNIVEISNDYGSVHAMAYLEPQIKPGQTFMLFAYPFGVAGDLTTDAVDENVVPYYKGTWAAIRRVGEIEDYQRQVSFKSRRYR